jgi:hypothetical protein
VRDEQEEYSPYIVILDPSYTALLPRSKDMLVRAENS